MGHLDVPLELPNALAEHRDAFGPALPVVQDRLFACLQAAHQPDALRRRDGSPEALFVTEVHQAAAVALPARLVPQVELLPAGQASVRQEQQSQSQRAEQRPPVARFQGGAAVSVQGLLPVLQVSLPRAEPATKLRAAQDALLASLPQADSQLAWPL